VALGQRDRDTSAVWHCVSGIGDEIQHNIFELPAFSSNAAHAGLSTNVDRDARTGCQGDQVPHDRESIGQVDQVRLDAARHGHLEYRPTESRRSVDG